MSESFELSRVGSGSFKKQDSTPGSEIPTGLYFRIVFAAEHCLKRKVYWVERALNGKTRLRQVLKIGRKSKAEDKIVAILPGDKDETLIRLAIAQANTGQLLTGIRWEVYTDFECSRLWLCGRFDHFDLFPSKPDQEFLRRIGTGDVTVDLAPQAWDYDGLLVGHTCPGCGQKGFLDFIVYFPSAVYCPKCDKKRREEGFGDKHPDPNEMSLAGRMMQRFLTEVGIGVFPACDLTGRDDPEMHFIDFRATPLLCWVIKYLLGGGPVVDARQLRPRMPNDNRHLAGFSYEAIEVLFRHSIFCLMKQTELREAYKRFILRVFSRYKGGNSGYQPAWASADMMQLLRDQWHSDGLEHIARDLQVLEHMEEWLFGPSMWSRAREGDTEVVAKATQVVETVEFYPLVLEELLEDKGKQFQKEYEEGGSHE